MQTSDSDQKTILFVHNNNDLYGAEVILLELLKRLDRRKFYPIVVLPTDTRHINLFSSQLAQEEIECQFVRMAVIRRKYFSLLGVLRYLKDFLFGLHSLANLIRRRHIALVHSNTSAVLCGAFAAWITGRPHVWHIHEIILDPVLARKTMHFLICHLSNRVLTVSAAVRDHILADNPKCSEKIKVIYNGIDVAASRTGPGDPKIRAEFGIPTNVLLVGMVGRVCRWKGQHLFLEAAKLAAKDKPELYFIAIGGVFDDETQYMDCFREAVNNSGLEKRFIVSDFRRDAREIMKSIDIFVLPSTQPDPFPTVVLEAMAASKPIVAAAHGGSKEMIREGQTGYLVPPNDPNTLAQAILRLADDPAQGKSMGLAGYRYVYERFRAERFASDFQELYMGILKEESVSRIVRSLSVGL